MPKKDDDKILGNTPDSSGDKDSKVGNVPDAADDQGHYDQNSNPNMFLHDSSPPLS
jgi:hypothetical protein